MNRSLLTALGAALLLVSALAATGTAPRPSSRTWTADNGDGTFTNPLFYDEFSDPDLIRVGSDYYMTGTTMHAMPGLPLLHSRDLVNWRLLSYAADRLDFGPEYRLENGKEIYGQGVWAPALRHHRGTFYIFDNIRGQPTQIFSARDPRGPWKRTPMKRGFHDLSVLFDDDGKVYVIWGYREIRLARLNDELTDVIPGTERIIIPRDAGMGEGSHFYKIDGKYYITSAWYLGTMRMPCARADRPEGPYEVVPAISGGEDYGIAKGALHQGGIVSTPGGEWWGFSMMDFNSLGRLTGLSPVTWKDGWPYFGLPGNLGRSPRTWVKPNTRHSSGPRAPFQRSDDFSGRRLQPVWQWNHAPEDAKWSLTERSGYLRLHSLPAPEFWWARNTLTQRAVGPQSVATAELDPSGMKPGDVAGLGLLNSPYAWIGVSRGAAELTLEQFDKGSGKTTRVPLKSGRVWLRADCDFFTEKARFSYSTDGQRFQEVGDPFTMVFQLKTFQGVRYSLFHYNTSGAPGGHADFDRLTVHEPRPRGLTRPIPRGKTITLGAVGAGPVLAVQGGALVTLRAADPAAAGPAARFRVIDRGLGRVALRSGDRVISVGGGGAPGEVTLRSGPPGLSETFQWIETPQGELTLLSLATHRYLRLHPTDGAISADHAGPQRGRTDGVRLQWKGVARER
ncbi:MAG: family 43 glycosylhydrolase [Armatimonadota bacterium]